MSIDEVRSLVRRGGMLRNEEAYVLLDALDAMTRVADALDELNARRPTRKSECEACQIALEALEAVEWEDEDGRVTEAGSCHWCHGTDETHFADCAVGTALGRPECQDDCEACQIERDEVGDGR